MISNFRNFAKTKFAGILVFIMIIPFVFWGMGGMFSSGNTNTIAKINKTNISTQEFIDYLNNSGIPEKTIKENLNQNIIEELLSGLVSSTLLDLEIKDYDLSISQDTLSVLMIGNSYTYFNNLPTMFENLSSSLGKNASVESQTSGGYTFELHANNSLTYQKINTNTEDKKELCESFNNFGFLSDEEAMIVIQRINLSLLSKQKPYEPPASFHRWGGILLTDKQGNYKCKVESPPCHVIEFHDNVEDESINKILSIIAEEENAQKNIAPLKKQTPEDIEAGLLNYIKGHTVKGKPATKKQKID